MVVICSAIFFLAAFLQGLSGFGFSVIAVPLITLVLNPRTAVPILILYSLIINLIVLYYSRDSLELKKIWLILLSAIVALPIGAKALIILPANSIKLFIGIFILVFVLLLIRGFRFKSGRKIITRILVGLLSGLLSGSISTSGPPVIMYFTGQNISKQSFRSNLAAYFLILNIITIPVYLANGLFNQEVLGHTIRYLPAMLAGVLIGNILAGKLRDGLFKKLTVYLLLIMGIISILTVIF